MATSQKLRINLGTFNLVKGILMILVVFSHMQGRYSVETIPAVSPLFWLLKLSRAGTIPMFFLISGYTFKEKPAKVMLKKTYSELVVPFLWGALGCIVLFPLLHFPVLDLKSVNYCEQLTITAFALGLPTERLMMNGHTSFSVQSLWFLLALFIAQNLLCYIVKKEKTSTQSLLTLLCVALGFLLYRLEINYYCIPQGLVAVGYCYAGYQLKKQKQLERLLSSVWVIVGLAAVCLLQTFFGRRFSMADGEYGLLAYLAAGGSGLLFMILGIHGSRLTWKGLNWLKKIGMYSYWIICIHGVEMLACPWDIVMPKLPPYPAFFLEVALKIIIITGVCTILKKISQNKYKKKRMAIHEA